WRALVPSGLVSRIRSDRWGGGPHQYQDPQGGVAAPGGALPFRSGRGLRRHPAELCDRAQHLFAVPQRDADFFEILIRQITQDARIDAVFREALDVLAQADRCEPLYDVLHASPDSTPGARADILARRRFEPAGQTCGSSRPKPPSHSPPPRPTEQPYQSANSRHRYQNVGNVAF